MKKYMGPVLLGLLLALCLSFVSLAAEERVYDGAGLFTAEEIGQINSEIASVRDDTGLDIAVVTSTNKQGMSTQDYADTLYEQGGFGVGSGHSGLLYLIDMEGREIYISTEGGAITLLSDSEIERLLDLAYDEVGSGRYGSSAVKVIRGVRDSYDDAVSSGWTYDRDSGTWHEPVKKRSMSPFKLLASAVVSAFSGLSAVTSVRKKYAMKDMATGAALTTAGLLAMAGTAFAFSGKADDLLNSRTERRALPRVRSGGSSGGGPHGRSTTHTSSGGRVHGGGGRKF